ncbi:hypothetical protein V6N13_104967 [Hibiscus sabdariffa]
MLTTFNEVDMTNMINLCFGYKDAFAEKHGVKLEFMSRFVKEVVSTLQHQPIVNAIIDRDDIIYRNYIDIIIAISTLKGLVVPVVGDAEKMKFVEIENMINSLAKKATDGTISIDEMVGGSLTISNSGVYRLSEPMVVGGNVVPRPLMYIALTYDHRLIDGRKVVFFLCHIKDVNALADSHGNVAMRGLIDKLVQLKEG